MYGLFVVLMEQEQEVRTLEFKGRGFPSSVIGHDSGPSAWWSDRRSAGYACLNLFNLNWSQAHRNDNQSVASLILKFFIEFSFETGYICHVFVVRSCHSCLGKGCHPSVLGRQNRFPDLLFGLRGLLIIFVKIFENMSGDDNICRGIKGSMGGYLEV